MVLLTAAACRDEAAAAAALSRWRVDSARYEADLAAYLRDSLVIDSIARTINTDSLYKLDRAMLHAQHPLPLYEEVLCERARLSTRYGLNASEIAIRRMRDTVWLPEGPGARRAMEDRMPTAMVYIDPSCHKGPEAPHTLNGTPLDIPLRRPIPPARP